MKQKSYDLKDLSKSLGYEFSNASLLKLALTHKSYSKENNERLEFLGDSVLNFSISSYIYSKFELLSEGDLTRIRSELVNRLTLSSLAKEIKLGNYIILGTAELGSGGHQRTSILADALEAIFGAIYLDSDIDTVKTFIINLFKEKLESIEVGGDGIKKDPKTELQEWLQARNLPLPKYNVVKIEGQPHNQTFYIESEIYGLEYKITKSDLSRKKAEQKIAKEALKILKSKNKRKK